MMDIVVPLVSLIAGTTLGCLLDFRFPILLQKPGEAAAGSSGMWHTLLSMLVAFGVGIYAGYLRGYVSLFIFLIGFVVLQENLAISTQVSSIVAIVVASMAGGFMAAIGVLPAIQLVGRLVRATLAPLRWRVLSTAGIGMGFKSQFGRALGGSQMFAVLLGIAAGLIAALICRLALRKSCQSREPTPTHL